MTRHRPTLSPPTRARPGRLAMAAGLLALAACSGPSMSDGASPAPTGAVQPLRVSAPSPDPRVGLRAGLFDAEEATWNMRVVSRTPPREPFVGSTNSDLAFTGNYAIQGNYDGVQIWDISNPAAPRHVTTHVCPASQSDVSVAGNLLFVSGEGLGGRLDCGGQGVAQAVSHDRLRGIRIFDISDIRNPRYVHNVQTCRGSHTHTVLNDPDEPENVYIYVSGSSSVRPAEELAGCSDAFPAEDPNSALFRIEVIRVPRANPTAARIVSSPRIFQDLVAPEAHGLAPADIEDMRRAKAQGAFTVDLGNGEQLLSQRYVRPLLDSIVAARGGSGAPTSADSAALRAYLPRWASAYIASRARESTMGPDQCHDITVYPAIGRAGGACEGYGLLLDIRDPANPRRLAAVSDSNFSYWHSATFSNDGSKLLFSDEWGGGSGAKCRDSDPREWGADAIFAIDGTELEFESYYKLPAPQTTMENCVAHNGSLIPIPGRDVMVQAWYQGGVSVFDWTDASNPVEIAFFDRGPVDPSRLTSGGSWSIYWYNGVLVSSEIARGLDILELTPSAALSRNEIDAAKSVRLDELNSQGQPIFEWPATFALAGAYLDQIERHRAASQGWVDEVRGALRSAEAASGSTRSSMLRTLADRLQRDASRTADAERVGWMADAVRRLAM